MIYRVKPITIEAEQWFKNGDHPEDNAHMIGKLDTGPILTEGEVVRYYRNPNVDGHSRCKDCCYTMHDHGWIDTLSGGRTVCPGDYIITNGGEHGYYPCKPNTFEKTYEI